MTINQVKNPEISPENVSLSKIDKCNLTKTATYQSLVLTKPLIVDPIIIKRGLIKSAKYESNQRYKDRVAKFRKRKTENTANYHALGYSGELYIIRALIILSETLRVHKSQYIGLTQRSIVFLLLAKAYLTASGKDYFYVTTVTDFTNQLFWRSHSIRSYITLCEELSRLNYINPVRNAKIHRTKYVLSMKSRSLFREIEQEFKKPFDIVEHWRNNKA